MSVVKVVNYPNGTTSFFDDWVSFIESNKQQLYIVTDNNVADFYPELLATYPHTVLMANEENKNLVAAQYLYEQLAHHKVDKSFTIIGLGGGVVTDLVGFVAATYLRGVNYVAVPTTVLGMVDAAIGGKNGVNLLNYKNSIGTISHPVSIVVDTMFLETLPKKQIENGFAEIIKHACIQDENMFNYLYNNDLEFFINNKNEFKKLIWQNIEIKNKVVFIDPIEKNERKFLNFGHTYGHAIENEYSLMHGHAISIGMVKASQLSVKYGLLSESDAELISHCLLKYNLPIVNNSINWQGLTQNLLMDKKRKGNEIDFVLLNRVGNAILKPIKMNEL